MNSYLEKPITFAEAYDLQRKGKISKKRLDEYFFSLSGKDEESVLKMQKWIKKNADLQYLFAHCIIV